MKHNPTTADVSRWLSRLSREQLREQGWAEVNRRFHGIVRAARPFIQTHFPNEGDQQAACEGLALALLAVGHFEDIERIAGLFENQTATPTSTDSSASVQNKAESKNRDVK